MKTYYEPEVSLIELEDILTTSGQCGDCDDGDPPSCGGGYGTDAG